MVGDGVGGVDGNGDAAGGHDGEIGDCPARGVLRQKQDPVAAGETIGLQRRRQRCHLVGGLTPADGL